MEIKVWPYTAVLEIDYKSLTVRAKEWKKNLYYDLCPNKEILDQNIKMITQNIKNMFYKKINTPKKIKKPSRDWNVPIKIWF